MASQFTADFEAFAVICFDTLMRPFGPARFFMQEMLGVVSRSDTLRIEAGHFNYLPIGARDFLCACAALKSTLKSLYIVAKPDSGWFI